MLEEDARGVLMFMASNGLVANPIKTAFMILNHKLENGKNPPSLIIGNERIIAESSAKFSESLA